MPWNTTLGLLGYGNMGSAIAQGLLARELVSLKSVLAYDPDTARVTAALADGVRTVDSAQALAAASDVLLVAVKPQSMAEVLDNIRPHMRPNALVISIAAGIPISFMQERLGEDVRVVRVMPNTPALVQAGASAFALGPGCTPEDAVYTREMFEAIGLAQEVDESSLDAVTAVSGSGPAYFFYLVECLAQAGIEAGLDEHTATRLATQTLVGAGKLMQASDVPASTLRERVTSKGGTTEAALNSFREHGLSETIAEGVRAAVARARELAAAAGGSPK